MSTSPEPRPLAYLTLEAPRVGQASHVHVSEIIAGLKRRHWSVRLLQPSYTDKAAKPSFPRKLLEYALIQARLWVGRRRGEVIYVRGHFMALPTAALAALFHIPIVHEVNGPYEDIYVTYPWLARFRGVLNAMQRLQYRWASHLLPVTQELANWLARETGHSRITVNPNGANTDLFRPDAAPAPGLPERPYAVFFGGLAGWHGVDAMLAAFEDPAWPKGVELVVVGDGQERDKVAASAARHASVHAMGYQPYSVVPGYVAPALCGLVTISDPLGRSRTGLLPLKLFETLACGVPVIVTDFPGQADIVREQACGLVVPVDDPAALARAVAELAANAERAKAMGARGAAIARTEYSWDRRAGDVDALLSRLRTR
jgi:glycosyltransferase involved in cell wall biosynthesis